MSLLGGVPVSLLSYLDWGVGRSFPGKQIEDIPMTRSELKPKSKSPMISESGTTETMKALLLARSEPRGRKNLGLSDGTFGKMAVLAANPLKM